MRLRRCEAGVSLAELVVVLAGTAILAAIAAPMTGSRPADFDTAGAARHLASLLHLTRMDAIRRGAHVALWLQPTGTGVRFATFVDGNLNGVRTTDISSGADSQLTPWETLSGHFAGVGFAIGPGVTDIDSGILLSGDPVRLGGSELLSFSPTGTATSGTLYLRGPSGRQFAVRVLGATGRVRVLRYGPAERQWLLP